MNGEKITFSEAMKLIGKHDVMASSETKTEDTEAWVILKNGWKIVWVMEQLGPYSELTPDIDIDFYYYLQKNGIEAEVEG